MVRFRGVAEGLADVVTELAVHATAMRHARAASASRRIRPRLALGSGLARLFLGPRPIGLTGLMLGFFLEPLRGLAGLAGRLLAFLIARVVLVHRDLRLSYQGIRRLDVQCQCEAKSGRDLA